MNKNRKAFLDTIAKAEGTYGRGDDGYDCIVSYAPWPQRPEGGPDYSHHPNIKIYLPKRKINSTAAGRYQILHRYYIAYAVQLRLPDFGHDSQDAIALQLIRECRALDLVDQGKFDRALKLCSSRWASLPGAGYGQPERSLAELKAFYVKVGGVVA